MGLGVGLASEAHTNEVASGKIQTAEACRAAYPTENSTISGDTIKCMHNGWIPGGRTINTDGFVANTPISLLAGYAQIQQQEARQIEPHRVLINVGFFVGVGTLILAWGSRDSTSSNNEPPPLHKEELPDEEDGIEAEEATITTLKAELPAA